MPEPNPLVDHLKAEVERLERALKLRMKVGDTYPGESQADRIRAIIKDIQAVIESVDG